jgi:hypothetical protein
LIDFVRQFATLDLFALPGIGCVDLSSRYIFKFWFSVLLPPVIMLVNYSLFRLRVRSSTRPLDAASVVLDVVNQEWQDKAREKADHPLVYSETKRRWVRLKDEARRPGCEQAPLNLSCSQR